MQSFEQASNAELLSSLAGPKQARLQYPTVRMLQIEADGDFWKGLIKPKIRIMGKWLERAGFKPGDRV